MIAAFQKAALAATLSFGIINPLNAGECKSAKKLPRNYIPAHVLYEQFKQRCSAFARYSDENPQTHFISAEALLKLIENPKIELRYKLSAEQQIQLMLMKKIYLTPTGRELLKKSSHNQIMFAIDNDIDSAGYFSSAYDFSAIRLRSGKLTVTKELLEGDQLIFADYIQTMAEEMAHANQRSNIARQIDPKSFRMDMKASGFCMEAQAKTEAARILVELKEHDKELFQACLKNKSTDFEIIRETAEIYAAYGREATLNNAGLLQKAFLKFWHSVPATNGYFKTDMKAINTILRGFERMQWDDIKEFGTLTGCKGNIFDGINEQERLTSIEQLIDDHLNPEADIALWFRQCRYAIENGKQEPLLEKQIKTAQILTP